MTGKLLETLVPGPGAAPPLWLDGEEFASGVMLAGAPWPWTRASEYINQYEKLGNLLRFDVASFPVAPCLSAWLEENPAALLEMRGKQRIRYALKRLLALEGHRHLARDIVTGLADSMVQPLVVELPDSTELLRWAHFAANSVTVDEVSEIDIDTVSVYLADYLRTFSGLDVAGVLVQLPDGSAVNDSLLELYSPLFNVARHYRWAFGIRVAAPQFIAPANFDLDYIITDSGALSCVQGRSLGSDFWDSGALPASAGDFYFAQVPAGMAPELVLERLARLRQLTNRQES